MIIYWGSVTISSNVDNDYTKILYGHDNIQRRILEIFSSIEKELVGCIDNTEVTVMHGSLEAILNTSNKIKQREIKIKIITDIVPDNLIYCKKLMDIVELRHLPNVKSNFGIVDRKECFIYTNSTESQNNHLSHVITSNFHGLVESQQYLFETLWTKALPAIYRIREIEEGIILGTIEVIYDSSKSNEFYLDLVKNAQSEIMLIFPTVNAFIRQEKIKAIQYLNTISRERNVKVRILMPLLFDNTERNTIKEKLDIQDKNERNRLYTIDNYLVGKLISVNYIEPIPESRSTILLVDKKYSLVMEIKDDTKYTFDEAIGLSIYSNSKPGVFSYISIFENLWMQTELYQHIRGANERLEMANRKLEIHDKILNEFIYIAAHELRNPIQPILGLSQVLRSKVTQKREKERQIKIDEISNILDVIIYNARKMNRLTDNVLDMAKIETGLLFLKKERFDLKELLQSVVDDYKSQNNNVDKSGSSNYHNHHIILSVFHSSSVTAEEEEEEEEQNADLFGIEADRERISQVISNLLNNALKFTNLDDTIEIKLKKKENKSTREVIVNIIDTGIGIDPEIYPRLFAKFGTKPNKDGTGLGLFVCKGIVEAHGGNIWGKNNNDDKGATFSFSLPLKD
ncbi:MAG: HAMP domain-containing sensor histidine kinase [Candidatus Nitrosocosmicus sp.]